MKRYRVVIVLVCALALLLYGCAKQNKSADGASVQLFAMDTYMKIEAYGNNATDAVNAAADEIKRLDELLSTGNEDSEIFTINSNSGGTLSIDTEYLVRKSIDIYKETDGAFDITIYPVMRAWGFTDQNFHVPDETTLLSLLSNVDASALEIENHNLLIPNYVEIDLGGIAKGYTGQQVVNILKKYGINSALVNLGGNIETIGLKQNGNPWKIGIEDPKKNGNYLGAILVSDKALVTSGGYERFFKEDGISYHHIIDPKTGFPANNGLISVTIVCEDGTLADGLSTALYIMGTQKAIDYWENHKEVFDCVLFTSDGKLLVSEGLKNSFSSNYKYEIIGED